MVRINRNVVSLAVLLAAIIITTWGVELRTASSVDRQLQDLAGQIKAEEWEVAAQTIEYLEQQWRKRRFWLALNNSVQDQQTFERVLAQVKVYVSYRDASNAAAHTALLQQLWYEFGE